MGTITPEKQDILDRVSAALAYLPDDIDEAEKDQPWLARILVDILSNLCFEDVDVFHVQAVVGLLGPAFSRTLGGGGGQERPGGPTALRVV